MDHPNLGYSPYVAMQRILCLQSQRQSLPHWDHIRDKLPSKYPPERGRVWVWCHSMQSSQYVDANPSMSRMSSCSCVCRHFDSKQFDCSIASRNAQAEIRHPVWKQADDHPKRCVHCSNFWDSSEAPCMLTRHYQLQFAEFQNCLSYEATKYETVHGLRMKHDTSLIMKF